MRTCVFVCVCGFVCFLLLELTLPPPPKPPFFTLPAIQNATKHRLAARLATDHRVNVVTLDGDLFRGDGRIVTLGAPGSGAAGDPFAVGVQRVCAATDPATTEATTGVTSTGTALQSRNEHARAKVGACQDKLSRLVKLDKAARHEVTRLLRALETADAQHQCEVRNANEAESNLLAHCDEAQENPFGDLVGSRQQLLRNTEARRARLRARLEQALANDPVAAILDARSGHATAKRQHQSAVAGLANLVVRADAARSGFESASVVTGLMDANLEVAAARMSDMEAWHQFEVKTAAQTAKASLTQAKDQTKAVMTRVEAYRQAKAEAEARSAGLANRIRSTRRARKRALAAAVPTRSAKNTADGGANDSVDNNSATADDWSHLVATLQVDELRAELRASRRAISRRESRLSKLRYPPL